MYTTNENTYYNLNYLNLEIYHIANKTKRQIKIHI